MADQNVFDQVINELVVSQGVFFDDAEDMVYSEEGSNLIDSWDSEAVPPSTMAQRLVNDAPDRIFR